MPIFNQNNYVNEEPTLYFADEYGNPINFENENHDSDKPNLVSKIIDLIYKGFY